MTTTTTTTETHRAGSIAPPDPKRWWALAVLALTQLMVVLDASIVNIALPHAQTALHITEANRQWVVTAYTLAFGGLLLLGGRIADFAGRKRTLLIGLVGFAAASALGGASVDQGMLFGARTLQGAFAALMAPAALSLITVTFTEPRERATAFGVYGGIAGGGAAIGLILGGLLTQVSWRLCLYVNVPIAVLAVVGSLIMVRESKAEGSTSYDLPGAVTVTGGLVALVFGFTEAAKVGVGWLDPATLGLLGAAVVLLVSFVLLEQRVANPLLPLRVLLDRTRGGTFLASGLVGAGLFAMFLFLTYYFQSNLGYSPLRSGFAFLPFGIGIIVSAGIASQLMPRTGARALMIGGLAAGVAGMLVLLTITDSTSWVAHVLPAELLISLGMGLVFVPLSSVSLIGIDDRDAGVGSALLNTTQQIGGALGTALLNTLFASAVAAYLIAHGKGAGGPASIHGYHVAFAVGAGMLAIALVAVAALVRAGRDDAATEGVVTTF
jgi:EmrB/QacA subfamily drug resistance transporter